MASGAHRLYPPHSWSPEKRETPGSLLCPRREAKAVTSCKPSPLTPTSDRQGCWWSRHQLGIRSQEHTEGRGCARGQKHWCRQGQGCLELCRHPSLRYPKEISSLQPPYGCTVCPCASHVTPGLHCDPRASVSRPLHVTQTHR